jgi:sulfonate transport system substrate-binding protein
MTPITRRRLGLSAAAAAAAFALPARAEDKMLRVGFQKYGTLVLLKGKGLLEERLKAIGWRIAWSEFPGGPQLLEALNAGAIHAGSVGEAPPIFAQAAADKLLYIGNEPAAPLGEAILVPKSSPIRNVAELKGKKVLLNKGSNVHFLLLKALEQAGLSYAEIEPVFLPPADARAAFERGSGDAWAIWDPFLAAAETATGARTLVTGERLVPNYQFYVAERRFADAAPEPLDLLLEGVAEIDRWAAANTAAAAAELGPVVGLPLPILTVALKRQTYGVAPLTPQVVADQQKVADAFLGLGLLPKPVRVADAVRRPRV